MERTHNAPNPPPLPVYVIYDPEADAYLVARVRYGSGRYCNCWSRALQRAKRYQGKRFALKAKAAIQDEGHSKAEVRVLSN